MSYVQDLPKVAEEHETVDQEFCAFFESIKGVIKASSRPLPTQTGDGTYIQPPISTGLLLDLSTTDAKDVETVLGVLKAKVTGAPTNDRTYLMERTINLASRLPPTSTNGKALTQGFLNILWNDLGHPPLSSLGDEYKYRSADGSNNNILMPNVGAANTPYARSVKPQTAPAIARPDPGVLFDSLMARKGFHSHPNKISSMLFYLASIIIHDLFRTDRLNFNNSLTSSYLDLAPLYGSNQEEQSRMRARDGKIKADCFSEKRLLGFPPGVGVLLIMFNRFHNYVVEQLATINEGGRFTKPANETDVAANAKYDNDLFQTGRLITCGLYVNIILKDYVRTILNLNRTNSVWDLDPRTEENKSIFESPAAEGVGNQVSAEFNLVYRWHSAVSERDDKWTQQAFQALFPGKDPSQLKVPELIRGLAKWEDGLPGDPQERPFANLQRADDGTLPDDALAEILSSSVEDVAGAFGANNVPMILRPVEILGIIQARSWNLATLNEFRAFFGLTKHETFEDINSSKDVADQLRHLYDEPDLVELYPGLVVEEAKAPMVPGSGLCASFTASRAILSDAVALVRGDRFFTTDYTPNKLTSWGYNEANYDLAVNQGCVIYKLILRAFPQHFKPNSVYAHYPFVIPSENKEILTKLERELQYDFSKPTYIPLPTLILTHSAAKKILDNQNDFKVIWGESITHLMGHGGKEYGYDFMLSGDRPANANSRCIMGRALYKDAWKDEVEAFYRNITLQLLRSKSYQIAGINQVDIVRDVGNLAQAHFAAEVFSLPLKTEKNPHAIFAEEELYLLMAVVFASIFYDADPAKSFPLRQVARTVTQELGSLVEEMVEPLNATAFLAKQIERFHTQHTLSTYGTHLIRELLTSNLGPKDIVWSQMLPAAGGMVANQGQLFAQCLDFYLDDDQKAHLTEIQRLAKLDTDEADELLMRYFLEGARIRSAVGLYRDVATETTIQDGEKTLTLHPGQRVMVDLVSASHDPAVFPDPEVVSLNRPLADYIHYGWGPHRCLGEGITKVASVTMLKTVAQLSNLRRVPGPQGQIKKIPFPGGFTLYMMADGSSIFPFPTSMKVNWDGEIPE